MVKALAKVDFERWHVKLLFDMNLALLIIEGADDSLEKVRQTLELEPEKTWRRGQPRRLSGVHATSGFSATIADVGNPGEMVKAIRHFLARCEAVDMAFSREGLSAEISIGVTVGESIQFVARVDFLPADLLSLGRLGVAVGVTAYPASDEADEADGPR
jgi:hypothetical protein